MRFTKLVVETFQAIQRAEIEFGVGLNVLYGPNDLGKSTLATAIRAVLLVPPGSAEAARFTPWNADATPRVTLTFVDDDGHYWRVWKGFGDGVGTGAELHHSKDGTSFSLDSKNREVEEKVRKLLAWGIPAPGGRTGPRGIPSTFLANVLLAPQTDVDGLLGQSLAGDPDDSGKRRVTKALATLAQDPLFKKVLDAAQREVDASFTPGGKRKRGQGSSFAESARVVKEFQDELTTLERQVDESSATELRVNAQREKRTEALVRVDEANRALTTISEHVGNTRAREQARVRVEESRAVLAEIDEHAGRVKKQADEIATQKTLVKSHDEESAGASAAYDAAEAALRAAEESHRVATSGDGARERELRRAQLAERAAELTIKKQSGDMRKEKAEAAARAKAEAEKARSAIGAARRELEKNSEAIATSRDRAKEAETALELARALIAYGRWRAAVASVEEAAKAAQARAESLANTDAKDAEAVADETSARTKEDAVSALAAALPSDAQAKALQRFERELALAEAALGGGISVALRPRGRVAFRAVVDQGTEIGEADLATARILEADRRVLLSIGELVDIEITAGAADKRRAAEDLRARWNAEAVPVLERAGVKTVAEVIDAIAAVAKERSSALELRTRAERLRVDAKNLRERAATDEAQAAKLTTNVEEAESRRTAIGTNDLSVLETRLAKLGKAWEPEAEKLHATRTHELKELQTNIAKLEQAATIVAYQYAESEKRAAELGATCADALASLGTEDPEALVQTIQTELKSLAQSEAENAAQQNALVAEASGRVEAAARTLAAAREGLAAAKGAQGRISATLAAARGDLHGRIGQHREASAQLEARDRNAAQELVDRRAAEFAKLPADVPATEQDVENAERAVATANRQLDLEKEELHKSEGALLNVGGAAVGEQVERAQEALAVALVREKELEVDAEAWKLLCETLRAVENDEGAHLGRALGGAVTTKFAQLTAGRYEKLRLGTGLETEGLGVTGLTNAPEVLDALSVGTRNQLATLVRLTIADQLKTAIILDDHLVHTDATRLAWFRETLMKVSLNAQAIVLTCRPGDYLASTELPEGTAFRDAAAGMVRAVDVSRVMKRWAKE